VSAPLLFGREDRVAGNENEAQEIVADMIVERCVEVWRRVLLDLELVAELGVLAAGKLGAAEEIDRTMLCGGHSHAPGLSGIPDLGHCSSAATSASWASSSATPTSRTMRVREAMGLACSILNTASMARLVSVAVIATDTASINRLLQA